MTRRKASRRKERMMATVQMEMSHKCKTRDLCMTIFLPHGDHVLTGQFYTVFTDVAHLHAPISKP